MANLLYIIPKISARVCRFFLLNGSQQERYGGRCLKDYEIGI